MYVSCNNIGRCKTNFHLGLGGIPVLYGILAIMVQYVEIPILCGIKKIIDCLIKNNRLPANYCVMCCVKKMIELVDKPGL